MIRVTIEKLDENGDLIISSRSIYSEITKDVIKVVKADLKYIERSDTTIPSIEDWEFEGIPECTITI